MNSVGSPMRKPQLSSASSREAHAPGTRIVTLLPLPAPAAAAAAIAWRRFLPRSAAICQRKRTKALE